MSPSSLPLKPSQTYGPRIDGFLHSSISTPFLKLFSYDLIEEIVTQMIIHAQHRGNINFSLTKEEMTCLVEILLVSEYHPIPFRRLCWSNQPDVYNQLVAESMRRNMFKEILRCLRYADSSLLNFRPLL